MTDIYLDCADLAQMKEWRRNPLVRGFTTNPTLIRAAGVTDYESFCKDALQAVEGLPISFEVLSDNFAEMERQARKLASFGPNVNVKIPVTSTKGESAAPLVRRLGDDGIVCNVTAICETEQLTYLIYQIEKSIKCEIVFSIFAGRIADTGRDPGPYIHNGMTYSMRIPTAKVLWASPRQVLDIYYAVFEQCHIITVTPGLLKKYEALKGKDLNEFSLDTVKMFYNDAQKAGYVL
jgi:transaldolase